MKMAEKKYPFSVQKHAHDIEFRKNRVWCYLREMETGDAPFDKKMYDGLQAHLEDLVELLDVVMYGGDGRVVYLTGKQIGLAKDCVAWASGVRANALIENSKTEYLKYC